MYSASTDKQAPPPDAGKFIRLGIVAIIGIVIFALVGNQAVILSMNFTEFGEQFTKPLYYTLVSTVILSAIALVRVNIVGRSSIFWYGISTAIGFLGRGGQQPVASDIPSFRDYKLTSHNLLSGKLPRFCFLEHSLQISCLDLQQCHLLMEILLGIENLPKLFSLPFVTPDTDPNYAV